MTSFFRQKKTKICDEVDEIFDIELVKDGPDRLGFLANFKSFTVEDNEQNERTVLLGYFIDQAGDWFKCMINYEPYFYVACEPKHTDMLMTFLEKRFEKQISHMKKVNKTNLEQINHLSGKLQQFLQISFKNIGDLLNVRSSIKSAYDLNQKKKDSKFDNNQFLVGKKDAKFNDMLEAITDLREYDVPYHIRVCIDLDIRASLWYKISFNDGFVQDINQVESIKERPDMKILAYDIETSKQPSKFPDAQQDCIMMISLMYETEAYLITNRAYCGQDVEGFDYAPKPEYECEVIIYNEPSEKALLQKFFDIIKDYKPLIITTFNGDFFDFPYIQTRAEINNMSLEKETGIYKEDEDQFIGRFIMHLDCYYWVQRDAYLPQGSHGLKAVTRAKLGYDPIECDPELMCYYAINQTQVLAEYAISDAVATFFLYKKHIHDFIFALCTIIPMFSDEVLRKGSGTLCENLLMACAFKRGIIFPNKQKQLAEKFYQGHLLDSETYIGGKVQCLNSGVYRADFLEKFKFDKNAFQALIDNVDILLKFVLKVECNGKTKDDVKNYEEVRLQIIKQLEKLRDVPNPDNHLENPLIYHLDVAAMYPNIILTNRLQPVAIVDNKTCSGCLYNTPESDCKRNLQWQWRGEYFPLQRREYEEIKFRLEQEMMTNQDQSGQTFQEKQLQTESFKKKLNQRVKQYCQMTYKMQHKKEETLKENTVCMRENSFYIDTIRDFRDRRYEFKGLVKKYKGLLEQYKKQDNASAAKEAKDLAALYESLQLAHKIILNSFYGYVMRKGARWYSMEMAAMVTHIGSQIISDALSFVDKVGKPLELDTDGIWGLLPQGFPENFFFEFHDGKKYKIEYPCSVLNQLVYEKYCNRQYQTWNEEKQDFDKRQEMSIFFELDGPYKAMIIPAAKEEGKMLKKRYAVFAHNGKLVELKGFELKRRGELQIIKIFQNEIFSQFLAGTNLTECYQACAQVAKKWLRLLFEQGKGLDDEEIIEYIGESKMLSRDLEDYGTQKGVGITAAHRMGEFLGKDIVKGKGLNTHFIISKKPEQDQRASRAIPISIFSMEPEIKVKYLKKWLKDSNINESINIKDVLDWDYYIERLSGNVQKLITIPAALQGIKGLIPEIPYPDWLHKVLREQDDKFKQKKLKNYFQILPKNPSQVLSQKTAQKASVNKNGGEIMNIEDIGDQTPQKTVMELQQEKKEKEKKIQIEKEKQQKLEDDKKMRRKNQYNKNTQFSLWLQEQKQIWTDQRQIQKRNNVIGSANKKGLKSMFKSQEEMIANSSWQIIQVSNTEKLGVYKLWVYLENHQLVSVYVDIERVIYVNSLEEKKNFTSGKIVKKKLPHEKKAAYLYEIIMSEEEFHTKYADFDYYVTNPSIEGVYEAQIPLLMKFITYVGNNAKLNKKLMKSKNYQQQLYNTKQLFPLEYIQGQFSPDTRYLENINFCYIVVYQLKMQQNEVWGIFNQFANEYKFLKVHKNKDMQKYNTVVRDILKERFEINSETKLRFYDYENIAQVFSYIDAYLKDVKDSFKNNILCIFNTNHQLNSLRSQGVKVDLPVMCLTPPKIDQSSYSSLDWTVKGIKFLCNNFIQFPQVLEQLIQTCDYAQIPLCNVGENKDHLNYVTNMIYSRALQHSNSINWYQDYSAKTQTIDYSLLIPHDYMESQIVQPGLYWTYCVEIDISLLALNTIALSDVLKNDYRDASMLIEEKDVNKNQKKNQKKLDEYDIDSLDEISVAKSAFKILKIMVTAWLQEVEEHQSQLADLCLQNIHRWIVSEDNDYYDPMLDRMLKKLMKLVSSVLAKRFQEQGAEIVFASMEKVIINTNKTSQLEADNYTTYILENIGQDEMFKYLGLGIKKFNKVFLFKDQYNYLGFDIDETGNLQADEHWNMIEFLPQELQEYYRIFILTYVSKIYEESTNLQITYDQPEFQKLCESFLLGDFQKQLFETLPVLEINFRKFRLDVERIEKEKIQQKEQRASGKMEVEQEEYNEQDDYIEDDYEDDYEDEDDGEMNSFIVDDDEDKQQESRLEIQKKKINKQKQKKMEENIDQNWVTPDRIGGVKKIKDPITEFINYFTHVLEFDENLSNSIQTLKRNCLKLFKISDFSEIAVFQDPALILKLNDFICKNCNQVVDLDLFRDDLNCRTCSVQYDHYYLQYRIVQFIKNSITYHQIQDLYCSKCKSCKDDFLKINCNCSGKYKYLIDKFTNPFLLNRESIIENLNALATHYNFRQLKEQLELFKV